MKKKLRLISAIIILSMIFPLFSGIIQPVFAADVPIKVYIDSYSKSTATVKIRWDPVPNVDSGFIEYHVPNGTTFQTIQVPIDPTKNTASISGIKNDIVYDFKVTVTDKSSQTFVGKQYFLAQVSLYAEQVDQQTVDVAGGGKETGVYPAIKLSWNMPKVFNASHNAMEYASDALPQIEGSIRKMNFTFNITSDTSLANVQVKMDSNAVDPNQRYTAVVSGDTNLARYSKVKWDSTSGKYSFYILGVKDDQTLIPDIGDIRTGVAKLPQGISQSGDNWYVLPHSEVRPGTIYKITMNTLFADNLDQYVGAVAEGLPENPLLGATNYTYTPIRFQLSKDTYNNIYVRIYRINQGGVSMPRLYYEVQTSNVPTDQDTSWTTRKKLDDTYFTGEFGITVLTGINPQNTIYYRVVVKSDGVTDRIQSLNMPYKMKDDVAKPPVPKGISVVKVDLAQPPAASGITDKSSNITISWDKPSNWDQIKGNLPNDIYFHFILNINAKDLDLNPLPRLTANGKDYGVFPVKYRLVKYVSANSPNIVDSGTKLVYTINGFDLFEGEDDQGNIISIPNIENYPTYLLPNKTYYLQMYTTLATDRGSVYDSFNMSEKSLVVSFTTLSPSGRDVPIPKYLEWVETTINQGSATNPANATVKIRFDDLLPQLDWNNYTSNHHADDAVIYDLYMSTRPDPSSFGDTPIGTTEVPGDVAFSKETLGNTTWVNAKINKFTDPENVEAFGKYLSPNTTYYFMVKVRLKLVNENPIYKESIPTVLLPVTTPRGEPLDPDDLEERPIAPIDFAIAKDANGNPMITGQTVTFEWTVQENAAVYNLISTSGRVEANTREDDGSILYDNVYTSFISVFGNKDYDGNKNKLTLDPNMNPLPSNFSYDPETKKCRYTIDTWLYPNKIYYFSLRAEIEDGTTKKSVWVSIPVTTSLIESPSMLQVVNDCELGFYWFDTMPQMTTESYKIMLKASNESDYILLPKSKYTIVKDGSVYYGRLLKLKANTQYSIKVVRATDNSVITTLNRNTRNDYYQIDVRWQGYAVDPFTSFEIAIKTDDDSDYTVLNNNADLEQYVDITTNTYPYYIEKSNSNLNNNYYIYTARIKTAPTKLPDGSIEPRPLKPNTKYYIKVRTVKKDSSDYSAVTPSKYVGPVNTRTEFNQDDYDDDDNGTNITAKFLDMIDTLERNIYWDVAKGNSTTNKVLVRDDRVVNILEGFGYFTCTIDISEGPAYIYNDEIYLAKNILQAMKSNNKSIIVKTKNVEYTIRPDTFDINSMEEFKSAKTAAGAKDVYLKLNNAQSSSVQPKNPTGTEAVSKMNVFAAQAVSSTISSDAVNALVKDKLYNDKTGIIQRKLAVIKNPNNVNTKGDAAAVNKYLMQLYEEVKSELSYYLEDTLNGTGYISGILKTKYNISKFSSPMAVKMEYKSNTKANPYVMYGSIGDWQKLTQNLKYETGYLSYFVSSPGRYSVFSSKDVANTVGEDNAAKPYISKLASSYDLALVFSGAETSFNSNLNVTVKESILLFELIAESTVDTQTEVKDKAKAYGLDKIINISNINRNISRQEAAAIVAKLYCQKTGADYDKLKASYNRTIKDDNEIGDKYAIPVYLCLDMNIMVLDSNSEFNPTAAINRADIAMAVQKMLEA